MRFDDSLKTVLSAETTSEVGAQAAWRQLVDLAGRGRVPTDAAIDRLRSLHGMVAAPVRAASARALAFATPPAALVALFGEDRPEIAALVLRTVTLDADGWSTVLPRLSPTGRSVLRHRRDLPAETVRALEAFGATDFVLEHAGAAVLSPIQEIGDRIPVSADTIDDVMAAGFHGATDAETIPEPTPHFEIADLVARIDAFKRQRERPEPAAMGDPRAMAGPAIPAEAFRFETDATGVVRWVDGVVRTPLVGLDLSRTVVQGHAQVDGVVAGACRRRSPFRDARLVIGGTSDAAGSWRLSGLPAFDPASGRFMGYRGNARRPRADESASPRRSRETSDSLRQLVHELRTPTNAIAGFAELIETELVGPVGLSYREHASAIRGHTGTLIQAIDDLDTAARIEGGALELRPARVAIHALVARAIVDLRPLADLRGAEVSLDGELEATVIADDRALERLVTRLLAALVSSAGQGERLAIALAATDGAVTLAIDRPAALGTADESEEAEGAPLLGTAFALRLASNLALELGGALVVGAERLTLRLPAAVDRDMGQASIN